jgi:beta-ketodecanoyl-[acyl-carrier-protein] synthase
MSTSVFISGSGLWKPEHSISNDELVNAYNTYADSYNKQHESEITQGKLVEKAYSSAEFIEKASGIKSRYVYVKEGILDPSRMRPHIPLRSDEDLSDQAEMAISAAKQAIKDASLSAEDIDAVIIACSYTQRAYPAISIEVQAALGIKGFAFDMLVACSAATFALHRAYEMIKAGSAKRVLVINPELTSPQLNYCDRDSHFIFGDVATAIVVEGAEHTDDLASKQAFEILGIKAETDFSNNIRSNFSYVSRANDSDPFAADKLFHQEGRKVFKDVCPMAVEHIKSHIKRYNLLPANIKRWWLHQANINMNIFITRKLLERVPSQEDAPIVLDEYANTASAGSIIAFHLHHKDMAMGEHGVLCSFGAGYSIGSLVLRKVKG